MATETIDILISENGSRTVRRNFADLASQTDTTAHAVDGLKGALAGLSAIALVREIISLADAYTVLQNKLLGAGVETRALTTLTEELFKVANDTRAAVEATAAIYSRLALSSKELGSSYQTLLDFTKSLNQALILSGATGHEAAAGLLQLSQAIASNRLGGDELRSILEQLPVVADVIAKHLKITRGELRAFGTQGKLTARVVLDAFAEARTELNERFARTIPTVAQGFTLLHNSALRFIGEFNQAEGVTRVLSLGLIALSDNFETLAKAILVAASALAVFMGAAGLRGLIRLVGSLGVLLAANPFTALVAALAAAIAFIHLFGDEILVTNDGLTTLKDLARHFTSEAKKGFEELVPTAQDYFDVLIADGKEKLRQLTLEHSSTTSDISKLWNNTSVDVNQMMVGNWGKSGNFFADFVTGIQLDLLNLVATWNTSSESMKKIMIGNWGDTGNFFKDFIIGLVLDLDDLIVGWNVSIAVIKKVWNDALPVLQKLWETFVEVIVTTWEIMSQKVQEIWVNLITAIATNWESLKSVVSDFVSTAASFIGAWAVAIAEHIGNALPSSIKTFFSEVYTWVVELFQKMLTLVGEVVNKIRALFEKGAIEVGKVEGGSLGIDPTQISEDAKKALANIKVYFGEVGNVAQKALDDTGNPVLNWVNKNIEAAQKAARDRKDFNDMFFPAKVDLNKGGLDLSKPTPGKGTSAKEIESLLKQVLELEKRLNPAKAALDEYLKDIMLLDKALAKGAITQQMYNEVLQAAKDHYREAFDEAFKARREFESTLEGMRLAISKGIDLKPEDILRQISTKFPDLFFGTDQEITNKFLKYKDTLLQIDQLEKARIVTEQQANQMRIVQAGVLRNAIIAAALEAADFRLKSGAGDWADLWLAALGKVQAGFTTFAAGTSSLLGDFYSSLSDGFANSIGRAIVYSEDLGEALYNVARGALSDLISGFIKLGIQWLINQVIGQTIASASTGVSIAMGAAVAAAWAPAAAAVSLASYGANAAPAAAGISATYALTAALSALGAVGGFIKGGFTGNGNSSAVAGLVHRREFVMNAASTKRIGLPALEAMQSGRVSPMAANNNKPGVTIINYGTSKEFDVQLTESEVRIISRDEVKRGIVKHAASVIASDISNPNGTVSKALGRSTLTQRRRSV